MHIFSKLFAFPCWYCELNDFVVVCTIFLFCRFSKRKKKEWNESKNLYSKFKRYLTAQCFFSLNIVLFSYIRWMNLLDISLLLFIWFQVLPTIEIYINFSLFFVLQYCVCRLVKHISCNNKFKFYLKCYSILTQRSTHASNYSHLSEFEIL